VIGCFRVSSTDIRKPEDSLEHSLRAIQSFLPPSKWETYMKKLNDMEDIADSFLNPWGSYPAFCLLKSFYQKKHEKETNWVKKQHGKTYELTDEMISNPK
jgi:hypothetical protein